MVSLLSSSVPPSFLCPMIKLICSVVNDVVVLVLRTVLYICLYVRVQLINLLGKMTETPPGTP